MRIRFKTCKWTVENVAKLEEVLQDTLSPRISVDLCIRKEWGPCAIELYGAPRKVLRAAWELVRRAETIGRILETTGCIKF